MPRAISYTDVVLTLQRTIEKFKLTAAVRFDAPLAEYTTFRVGGPADVLILPETIDQLAEAYAAAHQSALPVTLLGGGANVVVSDRGIRGVVIATTNLRDIQCEGDHVNTLAGTPISDVAAAAANWELGGLDFIYAMPGSTGGAIWMNARCYDGEISEVLESVEYVSADGSRSVYTVDRTDFDYKISPFQDGSRVIAAATFALTCRKGERDALWRRMRDIEEDRRTKGHFAYPCAGSIFKNNREFGAPSGKIIDGVGLRGRRRGGACVSPGHGNIIVNDAGASATDIRELVTEVAETVYGETGFRLEPEVLFLGDWS